MDVFAETISFMGTSSWHDTVKKSASVTKMAAGFEMGRGYFILFPGFVSFK